MSMRRAYALKTGARRPGALHAAASPRASAVLCGAVLSGVVLFGAVLSGAALGTAAWAEETAPKLEDVVSAKGLKGFVTADRLPLPADPTLAKGRAVWASECENCHGGDGLSGAPKITSEKKWAKRFAQGLPTLFGRAKEGFLGPTYKEMPARGGNPDLTDAEVEAAVAFMVWASGGAEVVDAWLSQPSNTTDGDKQ